MTSKEIQHCEKHIDYKMINLKEIKVRPRSDMVQLRILNKLCDVLNRDLENLFDRPKSACLDCIKFVRETIRYIRELQWNCDKDETVQPIAQLIHYLTLNKRKNGLKPRRLTVRYR